MVAALGEIHEREKHQRARALTKVGDRESDGHGNYYRGTRAQFPHRGGYAVELVLGVVAGGRAQTRLNSPP